MLYHIVSETSKFGQFRQSGFFFYPKTANFFDRINYRHPPSDRNRIDTLSVSPKSNLMELFSQATFPQCYNTKCQKSKNQVSSDGLDFFPINKPELFPTESTRGIHPRIVTAQTFHLSFPNRILWNFPHKPHFHNAISHSVRSFKIRSIPMVWIFFLLTNRNIYQRNQLRASTLGSELHRHSIYLFQIESSGTFLTSHISTMLYHIVSEASKLGQFRWSGFFPINNPELFSTESTTDIHSRIGTAQTLHLFFPSRISWNFSHKPHFHNAISHCVRSFKIWSIPMVWIFSYEQTGTFFHRINQGHPPSDRIRIDTLSISSKSNLMELFSQATFPQCHITQCHERKNQVSSDGLDFFPINKPEYFSNEINYRHPPSDRKRIDTPSISSKSNLMELFSQATFPQCYITQCQKSKNQVSSDGLDFFPINNPELFSTKSTTDIHPRIGTAQTLHLSFPNRISWNFSHKPHFHNAISHSVRSFKIWSIPMVWIFSYEQTGTFFHRINQEHPPSDRIRIDTLSISSKSNLMELFSQATFPQCHITQCHERKNQVSSDGLDFFPINKPEYFSNEINYGHPPLDRKRIDTPSISLKSNLMELFSQATFPQCYTTQCQKLQNSVNSDGLDFFPINKMEHFFNVINYEHPPSDRKCKETPSIFSKSNLLELFSQATFPQCYTTQCQKLQNQVSSDDLDFVPINKPDFFSTESTTGIHPRTGAAEKLHLSFPNRIFWNFSHKPHFRNAIPHSVRSFKIRSIPMVWIFFLSTNRNIFQRNQLRASTLGSELQRNSIYLFRIESYGTFLTSHISAMLYHIVSEASKFGQFRWSGFFSYQQTGFFFNGINYGHPPPDRNSMDTHSISLKSNLMELFSQATFPQCNNTQCQKRKNQVSSDGPDFFPINKPEHFSTKSTTGIHPGIGTAKKLHLSFINRFFWIFSHKPHFRNAIPHSVRIFEIRSIPMVWIFFLSTNRNFFQRNQLRASTLGPELQRNSIYFFQIESYGTFLTSHISTMLYHIVSEASKFGQFRWSGFVYYQQTGTFLNGINYGHPPSSRNCKETPFIFSKSNLLELFSQATFPQCYTTQCQKLRNSVNSDGLDFFPINKPELYSTESTAGIHPRIGAAEELHLFFPNRILWNFSHKPHFHNAIPHSVRSFKIRSIPMVWICLLSTNRNFFQRNQLRASTLEPELQRNFIYLFQIESSGTFLTSYISARLYHIVSEASKFGQFRWSGFFSYQQTGTFSNRINQGRPPSNRNCRETPSISSKSNLLELSSQATFPQCYTTQCQKLQNSVNSDGLDLFTINKTELFSTESTRGIHPRTGSAQTLYLSLPNRILCNFSHKPHFHNAISHSVMSVKIRSVPMVWIFFLSTNRNIFPTKSTTGVHPRIGTAQTLHLSLPNRILWNFSHKPHFRNAIPHSVRSFKIRSIPMVWIFFL